MAPRAYSENTYYSVLAARAIGDLALAHSLTEGLAAHADDLAATPARVDYFATSLPALLLFDEDAQRRQDLTVEVLRAEVALLAGDPETAGRHLARVAAVDPAHDLAHDLNARLESMETTARREPYGGRAR
jgi:hypothetical protein